MCTNVLLQGKESEARAKKKAFAGESQSDHIMFANAFQVCYVYLSFLLFDDSYHAALQFVHINDYPP